MEPRISLITLSVIDLARSRAFYERLGWQPSMRHAKGVVFFQAGPMVLSLFPREPLSPSVGQDSQNLTFAAKFPSIASKSSVRE